MPASESFKKAYICMKGTRERPFILLVRNLTPYNLHNLLCVCFASTTQYIILYLLYIWTIYSRREIIWWRKNRTKSQRLLSLRTVKDVWIAHNVINTMKRTSILSTHIFFYNKTFVYVCSIFTIEMGGWLEYLRPSYFLVVACINIANNRNMLSRKLMDIIRRCLQFVFVGSLRNSLKYYIYFNLFV